MKLRYTYIVCNALDETTRKDRSISTDSPAASRKVFGLASALRTKGDRAVVLSLGRGRADGSLRSHWFAVKKNRRAIVVYLPFVRIPFFSELCSALCLAWLMMRVPKGQPTAVIYYNRHPLYLLGLIAATVRRFRNFLDLEDGEVGKDGRLTRLSAPMRYIFDYFCASGAFVATSHLTRFTTIRPTMCYYGIATGGSEVERWARPQVSVLLGGSLTTDTGAEAFVSAVENIRKEAPKWAKQIRFEVTGYGECLCKLEALARAHEDPLCFVHGRVSADEYNNILARCDVGLALKCSAGPLAHSTFPSKVVELASSGLLVVTTDISDVKFVLEDGALYLRDAAPPELVERLQWIANNRDEARFIAQRGARIIAEKCSHSTAGRSVRDFLFR